MVLRYGNHVGDPALNDLEGHDLKPEILYFRELLPRPPESIAESYRLLATAELIGFVLVFHRGLLLYRLLSRFLSRFRCEC